MEIDLRYYNHLASSVPDESISVPIILHCLLEQVIYILDNYTVIYKTGCLECHVEDIQVKEYQVERSWIRSAVWNKWKC